MGSDIRADAIGGDFTLTDTTGKPFSLSRLRGKAVILTFGFTNCPDVCPTELLSYKETLAQLGTQAEQVVVVFVSVDPERDTPEQMRKYLALFHPDFIGLTATGTQDLEAAKKSYRITAHKSQIKSDTLYNVDHSAGTYLLDKQGNTVLFEPFGTEPDQIAHDIRLLLAQP